ncbi:hypothetical protein [Endozoicomonas ascidiicola]|uniref:hypothetical protein n=1 Tax=Endozoicomonas ascidiicola TaxID=1698521 RepID=UPI0008349988|nr:hypothetical protein [Endozoicomonas ascidiicola]
MTDMSLQSLKEDLKASLTDSAEYLEDMLEQLLTLAAAELARFKHYTRHSFVTLQQGVTVYDAPADLIGFKCHSWGLAQRQMYQPWQPGYPQRLPTVSITGGKTKQLALSFPPDHVLMGQAGCRFDYQYYARHVLSESTEETTVPESERDLLLLRAQAEAMKILSIRYSDKTISSKQMVSGATKIGTPAALYKEFLNDFERRASC